MLLPKPCIPLATTPTDNISLPSIDVRLSPKGYHIVALPDSSFLKTHETVERVAHDTVKPVAQSIFYRIKGEHGSPRDGVL